MQLLKILAITIIIIYFGFVILLGVFQVRLIFHPGRLLKNYRFKLGNNDEEVHLKTADGEMINGLLYRGKSNDVILYFHGNAGDLSGWQFVAEDFTSYGYNVFLIDYRGYGKSTGSITEQGLYADAECAYEFLIQKKFAPHNIIIYGRSIGSGVAVELATRHKVKALVLEAPYTSLPALANEKLPFLFPSLFLKFSLNNLKKINQVDCAVAFVHGDSDTLIPMSHTGKLYAARQGKKIKVIVKGGSHNDLTSFETYQEFIGVTMASLH